MIRLFLVKDPRLVVGVEVEVVVRLGPGDELGAAPGLVLTVVEDDDCDEGLVKVTLEAGAVSLRAEVMRDELAKVRRGRRR